MRKGHFLSTRDLSSDSIRTLFTLIRRFSDQSSKHDAFPSLLKNRVIGHLFFENSTRTRLSFEAAVRNLGGSVFGFAAGSSSLSKGESVRDTVANVLAIADASQPIAAMIVRSADSGAATDLQSAFPDLAWVNAGDGTNEHPTQALLDAFTLTEALGELKDRKIVIIGDVLHSRVARSNFWLLKKLGAKVTFCGPHSMIPEIWREHGAEIEPSLEDAIADASAVIALRNQTERHGMPLVPSTQEFADHWGLRSEHLSSQKTPPFLMHPGPVNWGVELSADLQSYPRSLILHQVRNGVFARMAVLAQLVAPREASEWVS